MGGASLLLPHSHINLLSPLVCVPQPGWTGSYNWLYMVDDGFSYSEYPLVVSFTVTVTTSFTTFLNGQVPSRLQTIGHLA